VRDAPEQTRQNTVEGYKFSEQFPSAPRGVVTAQSWQQQG
jgi:hypothetical protein